MTDTLEVRCTTCGKHFALDAKEVEERRYDLYGLNCPECEEKDRPKNKGAIKGPTFE